MYYLWYQLVEFQYHRPTHGSVNVDLASSKYGNELLDLEFEISD